MSSIDAERSEMIQKYFNADIDNPVNYDVVFNSGAIDVEEMVLSAIILIKAKRDKLSYR